MVHSWNVFIWVHYICNLNYTNLMRFVSLFLSGNILDIGFNLRETLIKTMKPFLFLLFPICQSWKYLFPTFRRIANVLEEMHGYCIWLYVSCPATYSHVSFSSCDYLKCRPFLCPWIFSPHKLFCLIAQELCALQPFGYKC